MGKRIRHLEFYGYADQNTYMGLPNTDLSDIRKVNREQDKEINSISGATKEKADAKTVNELSGKVESFIDKQDMINKHLARGINKNRERIEKLEARDEEITNKINEIADDFDPIYENINSLSGKVDTLDAKLTNHINQESTFETEITRRVNNVENALGSKLDRCEADTIYAKKNDVFDQVNIPQMYGYITQLWTRDYPGTSATQAYQMYNQENTTMEMRMIAEPKSKGVYVKCLQGVLDVETNPYDYEKIKDERDGKEYRIITIGSQTWMAENLNYDAGSEQSWCFLFLEENCEKYGRLYTWDAVMGNLPKDTNGYVAKEYIEQPHQGICPSGWHVPSDSEWIDLKEYVNDDGGSLKSSFGWKSNGNGSDLYHFRALPAGYTGNIEHYESYDKESHGIGSITFFHTTKQSAVNIVFVGSLTNAYATVWSSGVPKYAGASLRCVRNENVEGE
jgi:uncharacterized protein (TIGR02145 family)